MIPDFMLVIGCSIFISSSLLARAQYDQMLEINAAQKLPPKQVATVVLFIGFFKNVAKYSGIFFKKNCSQGLYKIAQSDHTARAHELARLKNVYRANVGPTCSRPPSRLHLLTQLLFSLNCEDFRSRLPFIALDFTDVTSATPFHSKFAKFAIDFADEMDRTLSGTNTRCDTWFFSP